MIISVASGKGGTGKTTVATNLAASMGQGVQLLDCDVEEPNSHLFLNPELNDKKTVFSLVPAVNEEKCTLCKKCAEIGIDGTILPDLPLDEYETEFKPVFEK